MSKHDENATLADEVLLVRGQLVARQRTGLRQSPSDAGTSSPGTPVNEAVNKAVDKQLKPLHFLPIYGDVMLHLPDDPLQRWAVLVRQKLKERVFAEFDLRKHILMGLDLSNGDFSKADLSSSVLTAAVLTQARFAEAKLVRADLQRALIDKTDVNKADFSYARLDEADMTLVRGDKVRFDGVQGKDVRFSESILTVPQFVKASLPGANFRKAQLVGAVFDGADLADANFSEANLSYASFVGANLRKASFNGAALANTDFSHADLDGATSGAGILSDATGIRLHDAQHVPPWFFSQHLSNEVKVLMRLAVHQHQDRNSAAFPEAISRLVAERQLVGEDLLTSTSIEKIIDAAKAIAMTRGSPNPGDR